jgi:hypothetical protein
MESPANVSDNARALLIALRAADGMYREMRGILSARGIIGAWALHRVSPETIAAARELSKLHTVARNPTTPDGMCYDEVLVNIGEKIIAIFGDERPLTEGETVRS